MAAWLGQGYRCTPPWSKVSWIAQKQYTGPPFCFNLSSSVCDSWQFFLISCKHYAETLWHDLVHIRTSHWWVANEKCGDNHCVHKTIKSTVRTAIFHELFRTRELWPWHTLCGRECWLKSVIVCSIQENCRENLSHAHHANKGALQCRLQRQFNPGRPGLEVNSAVII